MMWIQSVAPDLSIWEMIENRFVRPVPPEGGALTEAQKKLISLNSRAVTILYCALSNEELW
ncbi:hypothetical protein ACQUWZ_27515, partial [Ralstonia pseudosolanacearum]|uniref:hypothetical protein n=1 Tax=Ralstonia pseudosolanacearum TaxID=1310165 RepID=UPI003D17EE78